MFGYCIVVFLTAFSVICNKTFYTVYTLLSHTPHHTKSPLGSRGRDRVEMGGNGNAAALLENSHLNGYVK